VEKIGAARHRKMAAASSFLAFGAVFCGAITGCNISTPGLPDFSWYNIPKREHMYKMVTIKYTKWPQKYQMATSTYSPIQKIWK
jgi:hypothetical protein